MALVGVGDFGATLLDQARNIEKIDITVICDKDEQRMHAVRDSVISPPMMVTISRLTASSLTCWWKRPASPKRPPASRNGPVAKGAIVMASKEAGIVVGPILSRMAKRRGRLHRG